ncbi:LysR family transcriptional regulator [Pantoea sp. AG702]|uniref:LysR family transcriptional regulator n=1 Tax=Pantoea TaxID=53335 RepID=UPI000D709F61|nr:LysR family transcriptional regulator [Pantoea sp. AG702]PWW10495.1 DNA-binding transcriptional LysR family regulator [Pantoea sp. AG702]
MNFISLSYFVELAKNLNFTKTAQKLSTSQQNLSIHIKKLEDYYGIDLFHRKPQLKLTQAGIVLYDSSIKILMESNNVSSRINDIKQNNIGTLNIGVTPYRGSYWLPMLLPEFFIKWPNVTINITTETSARMEQMVISGDLDFFVGIKKGSDSLLEAIPLMNDRLYLAVTRKLLVEYFGRDADNVILECKNGTTLDKFKNFPFILLKSNYRLHEIVNVCFQEAGFKPRKILEVDSIELMLSLFDYDLGVFFLTEIRVPTLQERYPDNVFLPVLLRDGYVFSPLNIIYHKKSFLSKYAHDFISRTTALFGASQSISQ